MSALMLDAQLLYGELKKYVQSLGGVQVVGIASGGAWLAEQLHHEAGSPGLCNTISSNMHRDDYAQRGLTQGAQTRLGFEVEGADVLLLDDVLYTGRTIRAVLNELYDYGRPARVRLAVLVDRGGRQLPVAADYAAARVALPESQKLALAYTGGQFSFQVEG